MIAALGPGMLKLAASHAWGALPYNVTPEHTKRARDALGPDKWLVVEQMVCLCENLEQARKAKRQELARYMVLDNYRNNWLSLGFSEQDLGQGGSDRFLDAMVVSGNASALKTRIDEHFAAGANQVAIQPVHPELKPEVDWRCLEALAPG
jgi:probable F420-dependent oxidoreductase